MNEQVVQIAVPVPRTPLRGLRRQLTIAYHAIIAWAFAPGWLAKLILTGLSLSLLLSPLLLAHMWKYSLSLGILWIAVGLWKAYRELTPKNMQLIQRNYLQRKLTLYRLLREMERGMFLSKPEIAQYQEDVLQLIASYVRDHRADMRCDTIFVNLLVENGAHLQVVARDHLHRETSAKVPKKQAVAWAAMATGQPTSTGDVYADYPETPPGKPYRSILAIPVRRGKKVLGVVSIDSARRYHFDREIKNLVEYLNPYVVLLAWTLEPPWNGYIFESSATNTVET